MKILPSFFLILFIVLGFIFIKSHNGFAQESQIIINKDLQFDYAEKLFSEKDYETAMVEFKRFVHFFPDNPQKEQAHFKIGVCLFKLKKFHEAAKNFNKIIRSDKENVFTKEAYFLQSKSFMNIGNTGYAQIVLQNYLKLNTDRETKDRIYFNIAQIHMQDFKNGKSDSLALAKNYLSKISRLNADKYDTDQYLDLILKAELTPKKNPGLAGAFAIIPGGGFLYCERYHDAFVTFLLNIGLMYASYTAFDNDNKALSSVIAFVETGFYTGNIYGSISSVHKYNQAQIIEIFNKKITIDSKLDPPKKGIGLSFNYGF